MTATIVTASLAACAAPISLANFEQVLATNHSATEALTQWCRQRGMANPPQIVAQAVKSEMVSPDAAIRAMLAIDASEPVRYRQVHLLCGDTVLSIADNWYVPARLSPEMNHMLESSDIPFGRVVAPLGYTREQIASVHGRAPGCPEGTVLSVRAVLRLPDGRPISAVAECYTEANLAQTN
jgi:DNA-binding GntR family transcriptional regulator